MFDKRCRNLLVGEYRLVYSSLGKKYLFWWFPTRGEKNKIGTQICNEKNKIGTKERNGNEEKSDRQVRFKVKKDC